jgi:hypothetical protein
MFKVEIRKTENDDDEVYPCDDCGKLRSKNQGGTTFTLCDECWEKHFGYKKGEVNNV